MRSIRTLPGADQERGWDRLLEDVYGDREGLLLEVEDFAALTERSRNEVHAGMACQMVGFLAEYHPGTLGPVLRDLGRYGRDHGHVTLEDGRTEAVPGYRIPVTVQSLVLHRHVDGDLFANCPTPTSPSTWRRGRMLAGATPCPSCWSTACGCCHRWC